MALTDFNQPAFFNEFDRSEEAAHMNPSRSNITDMVFLFIQHNRRWMKLYLDAVSQSRLQNTNTRIPQFICRHYGLRNDGQARHRNPESFLIQSYQGLI